MVEIFVYFIIRSLLGMPLVIYNIREIFDPLFVLSLRVSKSCDGAKQKSLFKRWLIPSTLKGPTGQTLSDTLVEAAELQP